MNKRVGEIQSYMFTAGGVNETLNELQLYLQKEATQLLQGSRTQPVQGVSSASTTPIITSTQQRSVTNTPNPSTTNVDYSKLINTLKLSVPLLYSDIHPELMRA